MFNLLSKLRQAKARKAEIKRRAPVTVLKARMTAKDKRGVGEAFPAAYKATNDALRAGL